VRPAAAKGRCVRGWFVLALVVVALAWVGQAAAAAPTWSGRYVVRAGDSLTAIAQHYRVSLPSIAAANGLDWRKPLLIGVRLRVPALYAATKRWVGVYTVVSGDTLSGIAVRFHVSLAQLAATNAIDPAALLLIGAHLRIPTAGAGTIDLAHIAETNPYQQGAVGYDISYPNCAAPLPVGRGFAVIGLNAGRPFTTNPCFASEWAAAQPPRSVYVNTAYGPSLARHITPNCAASGRSQALGTAARRAYAVGCSEAAAALQLLGPTQPLALWLDVEPGKSWSPRQSLNVATITGILDQLLSQSPRPTVGIYSNPNFWLQIVGHWTSLAIPEWIATGAPDPPGCPTGFATGPVWLSQSTNGHNDSDKVC
jgi:LysM repeat protein